MIREAPKFADLTTAVKAMLKEAKTFEERAKSIEVALKFETLKLKSKGGNWGKGFTEETDDDDE